MAQPATKWSVRSITRKDKALIKGGAEALYEAYVPHGLNDPFTESLPEDPSLRRFFGVREWRSTIEEAAAHPNSVWVTIADGSKPEQVGSITVWDLPETPASYPRWGRWWWTYSNYALLFFKTFSVKTVLSVYKEFSREPFGGEGGPGGPGDRFDDRPSSASPQYYLTYLGTNPKWQKSGLGRRVIEPILKLADERGLECEVHAAEVSGAVSFYERMGFVKVPDKSEPGPAPGGNPEPVDSHWRFTAMVRKPQPRDSTTT